MAQPKVQLSLISNLWIKLMTFENAGDINDGHKHLFDHPTLLVKGRMEVDIEGEKTVFQAPHIIFITKETMHTLTALEAGTVAACIHAIRDGDEVEDIVDPSMIPNGVNPNHLPAFLKPLAFPQQYR
jgi:quercetin dioxygenase-like cupin family protein